MVNPVDFGPDDPQWRPVKGKPNVFIHDDEPEQEVEIIVYRCSTCGFRRTTAHSLGSTQGAKKVHVVATFEERALHGTCPLCQKSMTKNPVH